MLHIPRNNSNFTSGLFEFYRGLKWDKRWDFLKYYQNTIRAYCDFVNADNNGILAYLGMGMGKSILAASIIVDMIDGCRDTGFNVTTRGRRAKKCVFILTKSLAENMKGAFIKYFSLKKAAGLQVPDDPEGWVAKHISFVSMNASNMVVQFVRAISGEGITGNKITAEDTIPGKILAKDTVIAMDEVHNFFRGTTNGSKNSLGLYSILEMSLRQRDHGLFMLFLTGTPINNNAMELVPCFNLLGGANTLPEDYEEFKEAFVAEGQKVMKNESHFIDRILGLVAFATHETTPGKAIRGDDDVSTGIEFPEDLGVSAVMCPMAPEQYSYYLLAREKESAEGLEGARKGPKKTGRLQLPKSGASSSYRTRSRQLSNFYEGNLANRNVADIKNPWTPKYDAILKKVTYHNRDYGTLGLVYSQYVEIGGLGSFAAFLKSRGWTEYNLEYTSAVEKDDNAEPWEVDQPSKITEDGIVGANDEIVKHIVDVWGAHVTSREDPYAYVPVGTKARKVKIRRGRGDEWDDLIVGGSKFHNEDDKSAPMKAAKTFAVIRGGLTQESRKRIQDIMTSPDNRHGEVISLVLVSSVGAEGLDFKAIRHVHILEPYWNWARIMQIQYRGIRNDSHKSLPIAEKNVKTYVYCAVPPRPADATDELADVPINDIIAGSVKDVNMMTLSELRAPGQGGILPDTTDISLLHDAVMNYQVILSFLGPIQRASITSAIDALPGARLCVPTNKRLFTDNLSADLRTPDDCRPYILQKVAAKILELAGKKYAYIIDDGKWGFRIFGDKNVEISPRAPEFMILLGMIERMEGLSLDL